MEKKWFENGVHYGLEGGGGIRKPKWNNSELMMPIMSAEGSIFNIRGMEANSVIPY